MYIVIYDVHNGKDDGDLNRPKQHQMRRLDHIVSFFFFLSFFPILINFYSIYTL